MVASAKRIMLAIPSRTAWSTPKVHRQKWRPALLASVIQIATFDFVSSIGDKVDSPAFEGVAAEQSSCRQHAAAQHSVFANGFDGVFTACRVELALADQEWPDHSLVSMD